MNNIEAKTGLHYLAELSSCIFDDSVLLNHNYLLKTIQKFIIDADLHIIGSFGYTFDDSGVTIIVSLAESHVSIHTWPSDRYVTLDVFVCNHTQDNCKKGEQVFEKIIHLFQAKTIKRHILSR